MNKTMLAAAIALTMAACSKPAPTEPAQAATPDTAAQVAPAPAAPVAPTAEETAPGAQAASAPAFVDKVWQVKESSAVATGTRYTFLSDGTLVIESQGNPPGYGKWTYENGALTMIEEGQSYPTDILKLDAGTFQIRSHNPGEPVSIALVPATGATLPTAPAK